MNAKAVCPAARLYRTILKAIIELNCVIMMLHTLTVPTSKQLTDVFECFQFFFHQGTIWNHFR